MSTSKFPTFWVLIVALSYLFFSCQDKKEKLPPDFWSCHKALNPDSSKTHQLLLGKWRWNLINCPFGKLQQDSEIYNGLVVEFRASDSLIVLQNDTITQIGTWKLRPTSDGLFVIQSNPSVEQLAGRLLICGNQIEFNESGTDICDNFFTKVP